MPAGQVSGFRGWGQTIIGVHRDIPEVSVMLIWNKLEFRENPTCLTIQGQDVKVTECDLYWMDCTSVPAGLFDVWQHSGSVVLCCVMWSIWDPLYSRSLLSRVSGYPHDLKYSFISVALAMKLWSLEQILGVRNWLQEISSLQWSGWSDVWWRIEGNGSSSSLMVDVNWRAGWKLETQCLLTW